MKFNTFKIELECLNCGEVYEGQLKLPKSFKTTDLELTNSCPNCDTKEIVLAMIRKVER